MIARCDHDVLEAMHDGECSPGEVAEVERHLEVCAACRSHLAWLAAVDPLLDELRADLPPASRTGGRWRALLARRNRGRIAVRGGMLVAAGVAAILIGRGSPDASPHPEAGVAARVGALLEQVDDQSTVIARSAAEVGDPAAVAAVAHAESVRRRLLEDQSLVAAMHTELTP